MIDAAGKPELERLSSGHAETDRILHGGFPAHSINIVMGAPGTGKTILAQQVLFHNAAGDRPVVYLSTLSEPLSKVLTYLQRFRFYDESTLLDSVVYEDVGGEMLEHGVSSLLDRVRHLIREHRPSILVIDSFKAVHDLATSPPEMRRLAARLGGLLSAYDVTTFLIGEYTSDDVALYPEFAVADGVIQVERRTSTRWDQRFLRVLKLRGSGYEEGLHAFTITSDGIEVFPRLVAPPPPAPTRRMPEERLSTGSEGLDPVVGGGLVRGTSALVMGTAGTGKTTIGLGFVLEGVRQGQPSLFLNLQENPAQLSRMFDQLDIDLDSYLEAGLHLQYVSPVELRIDSMVVDLFDAIRDHGIQRVVIDGLADIRLAADTIERFHDYVYAMIQHFNARDVTALLTLESGRVSSSVAYDSVLRLSPFCDVLISLDIELGDATPRRLLRVVKARGSDHPLGPRSFEITESGLRVREEDEDA